MKAATLTVFFIGMAGLATAQTSFETQVSAILEPVRQVEIRTAVNGRIASLEVSEGQSVEGQDPLIQMDARVQRARVDFAEVAANAEGAIARAETA
ncbi:MAG: biotin/lipoyl-binding protein, partial [Pseudomonadota bacterium]